MNTLKKLLFVALFGLFAAPIFAQNLTVVAGLNMANVEAKDDDDDFSDEFDSKIGIHLGALVDVPISDAIDFQTGLLFSQKGTEYEFDFLGAKETSELTLNYIQVPITVKIGHELEGGTGIFGVVGPHIGYGFSGKSKYTTEFNGMTVSDEEDINWGSDEDDDLKPLDFGVTVGAGAQFGSIVVMISYDLGLANLATVDDNGNTFKNKVFRVTAGYALGGN